MKASAGRERMKDRSLLTKKTDAMKVAHTQIVKCFDGRVEGGHDNHTWHCEVRAKDMVDRMATMVRVEEMDVLKMEAQR